MKIIDKAVLPEGFLANGLACGLKNSGKPDLALIYSPEPCLAGLKSTINTMAAAPIKYNKSIFKAGKSYHAIIANSGNANAFTGKQGFKNAESMSIFAANQLKIKKENVFVASTGIIGKKLAIDKIKHGLPSLASGLAVAGIKKASAAIITTDKFSKEVTVKFNIGAKEVTLCAIAKGAGMISPKMATMFCFIFTDANISQAALNIALDSAVTDSFNRITVDGCMSTNDTVILLANKLAGNTQIKSGKDLKIFSQALTVACLKLAKLMVKDGEGSTKVITIKVNQAKTEEQAKKIALAIANYNLFKVAMFASSTNMYGRLVAAVGSAGMGAQEEKLKVKYSSLNKPEVEIDVALGLGKKSAVVYTSDLSYEYIKINADYN